MKIKLVIGVLLIILFPVIDAYPLFAQTTEQPDLTIISPQENSQIFGSKTNVSFIVNNFIFTNFSQRPKKAPGEGHLHVWLDKETLLLEEALEIAKATDFTIENVAQGHHQLVLEFVNNDHTSFKPKIIKSVNFTSKSAPQSPTPLPELTVIPSNKPQIDNQEDKLQTVKEINNLYVFGFLAVVLFILTGVIFANRKKH